MSKYAVAIIDMQKAYFAAGDLKGLEGSLVTAANSLISTALEKGIPVFNIMTLHARDQSTWTLNMLADGEGYLFEGEKGADVLDGLKLDGTITLTKTRDSAFFRTPFAMLLEESSIDSLILLGVSTHSCIYQTASDAYASNLRVIIAKDAVTSHDMHWHEPALEILKQEYRQSLLGNDEIIELFNEK